MRILARTISKKDNQIQITITSIIYTKTKTVSLKSTYDHMQQYQTIVGSTVHSVFQIYQLYT